MSPSLPPESPLPCCPAHMASAGSRVSQGLVTPALAVLSPPWASEGPGLGRPLTGQEHEGLTLEAVCLRTSGSFLSLCSQATGPAQPPSCSRVPTAQC